MKQIFFSYAHEDYERAPELFEDMLNHLRGLQHDVPGLEVWIDRKKIRLGQEWHPEIDAALANSTLAVLVISPAFLASDFIRECELPRLQARHEEGLPLLPIALTVVDWPGWLEPLQIAHGTGKRPLKELRSPEVDQLMAEVTHQIRKILDDHGGQAVDGRAHEQSKSDCVDLVRATLIGKATAEGDALSLEIVRRIGAHTGVTGDALFDAVRYSLEFHLLRGESVTAVSLAGALDPPARGESPLVERLRRRDLSEPLSVSGRFFLHTLESADLWRRYFAKLVALRRVTEVEVRSLAAIVVKTGGFLAPKFLVAGLLSRFEDDWRPLLNAYAHPSRVGPFRSLQASQWICWLMWGPSVAICQCTEWCGVVAYQYGYGDESNSVPLIEAAAAKGEPSRLAPILEGLRTDGRGAAFARVTARLRWAPFFLEGCGGAVESKHHLWDSDEELDDDAPKGRIGAAKAQASLYDHLLAHRQDSDGIVLELVRVEPEPDLHIYYSAYLWAMFLVATGKDLPGIGPDLLWGEHYPASDAPAEVRAHKLWNHLIPSFVHANIGDPEALWFQKRMLVENSLELLRRIWLRRDELFEPGDVEKGVRFHLVAASDYSGCGHSLRFPPSDPLVALLRERVAAEPDRVFAASVVLPAEDETPETRPPGLAHYFSACRFPELIAHYYHYIDDIRPKKTPYGHRF